MSNSKAKMQEFSVIMSVYKNDQPDFLKEALESVSFKQTVRPSEIILVVDGPISDDLNSVILKFARDFHEVYVIRNRKNLGLGLSLRRAVEACKYDLVARMDSDDISVPDRFEQQLNILAKNKDIDIVGGDIEEFTVGSKERYMRRVPQEDKDIKQYMKTRCAMNHMTIMFKREAVLSAGNYRDFYYNEDYDLWIRLWIRGAVFANSGSVLVNARTDANTYRRRGGLKYFKSELKIQAFMLDNNLISLYTYGLNILKRFILQALMPATVRQIIFKKIVRTQNGKNM